MVAFGRVNCQVNLPVSALGNSLRRMPLLHTPKLGTLSIKAFRFTDFRCAFRSRTLPGLKEECF